jgi:hypothetical protein
MRKVVILILAIAVGDILAFFAPRHFVAYWRKIVLDPMSAGAGVRWPSVSTNFRQTAWAARLESTEVNG